MRFGVAIRNLSYNSGPDSFHKLGKISGSKWLLEEGVGVVRGRRQGTAS